MTISTIPRDSESRASAIGSRSIPGSALSGRATLLSLNDLEENEPYIASNKEIDNSYKDPLGPLQERPKTILRRKQDEDDFGDEDIGDELLPE